MKEYVNIEKFAEHAHDEMLFGELKREMIEQDKYEIERRLRVYVSAAVQSQFHPGNKAARERTKLAYKDFWAYIMPLLEER